MKQNTIFLSVISGLSEESVQIRENGSHSTISILGSNIDTYSQKELIDTLLYVPQKGFFFAGTIRENLMYGLSDKVSDKELIVALRSVCLYDSLVATVLDKNFVAADGIDKWCLIMQSVKAEQVCPEEKVSVCLWLVYFFAVRKSSYSMKALQVLTEIPLKKFFLILKNTQKILGPVLSTFLMMIV